MKNLIFFSLIFLLLISCYKKSKETQNIEKYETILTDEETYKEEFFIADNIKYPINTRNGIEDLFNKHYVNITQEYLKEKLDEKSKKEYSNFKTRINNSLKEKINFGGKYLIIEWGCGTECQTGVIINLEDGKIFSLPTTEWGAEYKPNSLLFVANPPSVNNEYNINRPYYAYPRYYIWNKNKFDLICDTGNNEIK
ncbi:MAG: hypothetical protein A2086_04290 [Spirochaetes bacterium GWD1_27_9]|nr:MAG: hypothetical protein A2Z98_06125 [Spirochaetes bacterium GWB1_27_13]OHD22399.1 MAG: hypothetical protein A2Y34_03475 [Spirochaetes bacterium GWC1_27_15]OHD41377.1 MAG: hypothetical protein A2086_04290 [Spirochaetes bacterium GWD1_27_9]